LAGSVFLLALTLRAPTATGQVALFFSPGTDRTQAIASLGAFEAGFVRPGRLENIVVAAFEEPAGFRDLWANGVWFAFDPLIFGGCLVTSDTPNPLLVRTAS
jgi:hypothetical protein